MIRRSALLALRTTGSTVLDRLAKTEKAIIQFPNCLYFDYPVLMRAR